MTTAEDCKRDDVSAYMADDIGIFVCFCVFKKLYAMLQFFLLPGVNLKS